MGNEEQNTQSPAEDTPVEVEVTTETQEAVDVEKQLRKELEEIRKENAAIKKELATIKASPMASLLEIKPINKNYNFNELVELYNGDEMNAFGAAFGELELELKRRGITMGVNQARTTDGEGRESSSGISKKGSVEFDSVSDLLHMPPALIEEAGRRGLVKIVCGNTSWVGADQVAQEKANQNTSSGWQGF